MGDPALPDEGRSVTDSEADEMEEHLRGLGYLEYPPATEPKGG